MSAGRVLISAAGSGHGKSVVTMGLLQAMKERGIMLRSFKCGPDYIDPGFHERVLSVPCRNLDTYLMGEEEVLEDVSEALRQGFLCAAEGAMGLYDGLGGTAAHSAYSIACLTGMPVLAVLDAGRGEPSVSDCTAQLQKLLERDEKRVIRGVLINRCREDDYLRITESLGRSFSRLSVHFPEGTDCGSEVRGNEEEQKIQTDGKNYPGEYGVVSGKDAGICLCGFLLPMPEAVFPSRHLGLVKASEAEDFAGRMHRIAGALEKNGCVDAVLRLAENAPANVHPGESSANMHQNSAPSNVHPFEIREKHDRSGELKQGNVCRIAVAKDEAFSFIYQRALENLERLGAQICFFSPLCDDSLPERTDGLYLPGGYPELYAQKLEENMSMRYAVREAVLSGMPAIAECGGFLYLGKSLASQDGREYEMAGVLEGRASRKEKLVRFGYLEIRQEAGDSLLFHEGECVRAHEFHYWDSTENGSDLLAVKCSKGTTWRFGHAGKKLYAGFPHLYLNRVRAERFVRACEEFSQNR